MSYRQRGHGGGGQSWRRGGRGPNRGGGRGRGGGGQGRGGGGQGRGGGGPPPGLSGRDIGMFYARKSRQNREDREKKSRAVVSIDKDSVEGISEILNNVRQQSSDPINSRASQASGWSDVPRSSNPRSSNPGYSGGALQAPGWSDVPSQPSTSSSGQTEHCDWYSIETVPVDVQTQSSAEPMEQGPHGHPEDTPQASGGSMGFRGGPPGERVSGPSSSATPPSWDVVDPGAHTVVGGVATTPQGNAEMDKRLLEELMEARSTNERYKRMLDFRQRLPSWKAKEELLELIKGSQQVSVISGETGCGKTTQVPQFILDDAIMNGWGSRCHIICTQPRRISAISVAQRVAAERGESLGKSSGYQIRLENTLPRSTGSILYCTTGILLRRLIGDPHLAEVSHIIMDEIHERNIMSDFLTIIMRDLLPRRPDLKVIVMSATLNAEMFSSYFNNAPMYKIQNVAYPVAEYFLEDILKMTNYQPQSGKQSKQSKSRPYWSRYGEGRKEYMKEEEEEREKEEYFNGLEAERTLPGRVLQNLREFDEKNIDLDLILNLVRYITTSMGDGAILIFLPGWDTISKLHDMLMANPVFRGRNYLIIPLHSMMPTAFQQKVFDRPPQGVRKIVIATNIAETSITIDDVVFVIDCGKVKETTYDAAHQMACLEAVWVSKAAARQRRGRAGRVQAGHCFHVFTKFRHNKMAEFQLAEMLRTPLEELVLQIKILRLGMVMPFLQKAIEPPHDKAVQNALQCLRDLNALTAEEKLTPLGHHLANLPVNPRIGKIILFGAIFSCLDPVLTIASALGFKEPFVIPLHKQEEADALKKRLAGDTRSDHIALLKAYRGWEEAKHYGNVKQYCWDNFLANNTLQLLQNMKKQFCGLLYDIGFISSSYPDNEAANYNSNNMKLVKAVLCAGLYPNVVKIQQNKPGSHPKLITRDGKVKFHPKSVNCDETYFNGKYLIYHTKVKSSAVFIHDSSLIPPFPLLFFGGDISMKKDAEQETIAVDDWIVFQASQDTAELVKEMRQQLDSVLHQKVSQPRMELYDPYSRDPSPNSQLIQAIIDLITKEDYSHQAARLAAGKHLYVRGK